MNHKVNNVQNLHESAKALFDNVVGGGDSSADSILNNLNQGIERLKANWKGIDAGKRIEDVIVVHNAMVAVRNALASLAVDSSKVAANYRDIQNANGGGLETLSRLSSENLAKLADYYDNSDTVDINSGAEEGKKFIDLANASIDTLLSNVKTKYSEIMENWTEGTARNNAIEAFDNFILNVDHYKQVLSDVSSDVDKALKNYKF